MAGRWEHLSHEADVGVRGIGSSLAEALAQAARAMTGAVVDLDSVRPQLSVEIQCAGRDAEDLLYAWLNAVIYEMATRRMLFNRFDVQIENSQLRAIAWGEPVSPNRHEPAVELKGATFTALRVRREDDQWAAECVVDV
jgi:tRNA nucleotidyltransferase (CCA-adding enzyme)